jgi:hypothetical protein
MLEVQEPRTLESTLDVRFSGLNTFHRHREDRKLTCRRIVITIILV